MFKAYLPVLDHLHGVGEDAGQGGRQPPCQHFHLQPQVLLLLRWGTSFNQKFHWGSHDACEIVNWQRWIWTSVTQELLLGSLPHQSQVSDKVTYAVRINHKPYKFKGKYFNGTTTNECSFDTLKSELSENLRQQRFAWKVYNKEENKIYS